MDNLLVLLRDGELLVERVLDGAALEVGSAATADPRQSSPSRTMSSSSSPK